MAVLFPVVGSILYYTILQSECLSTGLTKFFLVVCRLVNLQVRDEGKFGGLSHL